MSTPLRQGEGPFLGPLSNGTEMLDPILEAKERNQIPQSKLTIEDGSYVDLKTKAKAFNDGPLPPESPSQQPDFGTFKPPDLAIVKKPVFTTGNYVPGKVLPSNKVAIVDLAENISSLPPTTTGIIVQEGFDPVCEQYTEGTHFLVEKKLSMGSFGTGEMCIDSGGQNKKFFRKKIAPSNFRSAEVTVPVNLDHENVTKVYGLINRQENEEEKIVELMIEPAGTALNSFVNQSKIDAPKIWDITKQTMAGLHHMHLYGMIHFDIKQNLCVQIFGDKLLVKITDFGSSKLPTECVEFIGWTPEYMAPETSKLFLQARGLIPLTEITESDLTGKLDVFAGALVIMYLYEKVHVLQRLISNGKNSYTGLDQQTRMEMQINLMKMLACDPNFVQSIIPDTKEIDIDMRELLHKMTQHHFQDRCSAQDVVNFIDRRNQRQMDAILECRRRLQIQRIEKERMRAQEPVITMPFVEPIYHHEVPAIAYNCMETDTGPIKIMTRDKLRDKIKKPYGGKGKGKMMREEAPVQEMRNLQASIASKHMEDYQPPPTPVTEVSISMSKLNMQKPVATTERNAPVTQPMADEVQQRFIPNTFHTVTQPVPVAMTPRVPVPYNSQRSIVDLEAVRQRGLNKALPPQIPTTTTVPEQPKLQNNHILEALQAMLKNSNMKIAITEKGPRLVQLPEGGLPTAPTRRGVTPYMPTSPPDVQPREPELLPPESLMVDDGNVPDFLKLG